MPSEELLRMWFWDGGSVTQSGMVWSGMPSVPLIVDNHVFIQANNAIYKLDSMTGSLIDTVVTYSSTTDFYHYLGYAGGYIVDYTSHKVYDTDLNYVCSMSDGIKYVVWSDGFFYAIGNSISSDSGTVWKMSPAELENGVMKNLWEYETKKVNPNQYLYGTTSKAVIDESENVMYYISTEGSVIYINALDFDDGKYDKKQLTGLTGYYLDDGWLTLYKGHLYMTAYTVGLFGTSSVSGSSTIAYMDVNGTTIGDLKTVSLAHSNTRDSLTSALVIQNDRAYVNVTVSNSTKAYFQVYDILEDGTPKFVEEIQSISSHGSLVASTYYLSGKGDGMNGSVYIYLLNYSSDQYLYIFTDNCVNGKWDLEDVPSIKSLDPGFGSQAVRVGTDGQLIFYNDSGKVYSYGSPRLSGTYYFLEDTGSNATVREGFAVDRDSQDAFLKAFEDAFNVKNASFGDNGMLTVGKNQYYVYMLDESGQLTSIFDGNDLVEDFSKTRGFYLTTVSSGDDIDPDKVWYGSNGSDRGVKGSGGLSISDDRIYLHAESLDESASTHVLTVTNSLGGAVKWSSTASNVASVSVDGTVTAHTLGQALITATVTDSNGKSTSVSCMVYVTQTTTLDIMSNITMMDGTAFTEVKVIFDYDVEGVDNEIKQGSIGELIELPNPKYEEPSEGSEDGSEGTGSENSTPLNDRLNDFSLIGWSDGTTVFKPGEMYIITGQTVLTAVWVKNNVSIVDMEVRYGGGDVSDLDSITLRYGESEVVEVTIYPEGSGVVSVVSSNPKVVEVTVTGNSWTLKALRPGTVDITVTGSSTIDKKEIFTITVPALSVLVEPEDVNLGVGDSSSVSVSYEESGEVVTGSSTYVSESPNVVSIDKDGTFTAVSAGTAVITVAAPNGVTSEFLVSVKGVESISISGYGSPIQSGRSVTLKAVTDPVGTDVSWSSGNTAVATVDANGKVTALSEGYAVITATAKDGSGMTGTVVIQVVSIKVTDIELEDYSLSLKVGEAYALKATVSPDNAADKTLLWTSSNPAVASVSSSGVVTGISAGTAVITVSTKDGSVTETCDVKVVPLATSVSFVGDETSYLNKGDTLTLNAVTEPVGAKLVFKSSDPSVASVSSSGVVKALKAGTAVITVTASGTQLEDTCTIVVTDVTVDVKTEEDGTKTTIETSETILSETSTVKRESVTKTDVDGNVTGSTTKVVAEDTKTGVKVEYTETVDGSGKTTHATDVRLTASLSVSGGIQNVKVTPAAMDALAVQISAVSEMIGLEVDFEAELDARTDDSEMPVSVVLPSESLGKLIDDGSMTLKVRTNLGALSVSSETIENLVGIGGDIKVDTSTVDVGVMTPDQATSAGGRTVYSITMSVGGKAVSALGGTMDITLPYTLGSGESPSDLTAYYLDDSGKITGMGGSYDSDSGEFTFRTTHLSYYFIGLSEKSDADSSGGMSTIEIIGCVIAVLLAGMLAVMIYDRTFGGRRRSD
ncbi:Ig-like domain-containing protein [Candidatus Methanoprimaticola sp. MG2]|uniref:Ig-like domain-containing protein n=1 Tax=Candidatus Methanoprimaticola sp. MG2 TaxID=3228838 RepID=UPI0039C74F0D